MKGSKQLNDYIFEMAGSKFSEIDQNNYNSARTNQEMT